MDAASLQWSSPWNGSGICLDQSGHGLNLKLGGFSQSDLPLGDSGLRFFAPKYAGTSGPLSSFMTATTGSVSLWFYALPGNVLSGSNGTLSPMFEDWALSPGWDSCVNGGEFFLGYDGTYLAGGSPVIRSPVALQQWTHAVLVHSAGTLKLYINGILVKSRSAGSLTDLSSPIALGLSLFNNPFYGCIEDVRVFNRGLSDSEVLELYNGAEDAALSVGLSAHWEFAPESIVWTSDNEARVVNRANPSDDQTALNLIGFRPDNVTVAGFRRSSGSRVGRFVVFWGCEAS
jgi:hypothetical protein